MYTYTHTHIYLRVRKSMFSHSENLKRGHFWRENRPTHKCFINSGIFFWPSKFSFDPPDSEDHTIVN